MMDVLKAENLVPEPAPLTAGARVVKHHTFSQPQLRVALQGRDNGLPVMLSHALGLDFSMWDRLAGELGNRHPVLRYDHRGHGGSAVPPGPYSMDDLVDDAARLIREWGRGPVVFAGLSMGGMVGQGLGVRHPELLRGLVLANTTAQYPPAAAPVWAQRIAAVEAGGMAAVANAVVERYLHADFRASHPALAQALHDQLLRCDPRGYVACCHAVAAVNWLDRLSGLTCPTLVISGARDVGATPEMGRAKADRIVGCQFVLLDDASHLSVAEQPQEFLQTVVSFIEKLPAV